MKKFDKSNRRTVGALALATATLFSGPSIADPPVQPPIPGTVLPRVFCFRITDIRADKTDPELNKFHFEFEVLNWSDVDAGGLDLSLAMPTPGDVVFAPPAFAGVDVDGRPLFLEDTNGDSVIDAADDEDANGNGRLDPGEDQNANGRLDNDPIPGNLAFPNDWSIVTQTATKMVWSAPEIFPGTLEGIPYINLIGAAGASGGEVPDQANNCVPGVDAGTATVDMDGNVTPLEAIDNENNVLDGFVVTLDGLDAGESVNINWFLTGAGADIVDSLVPAICRITNRFGLPVGEPIGVGFEANDYGFGVITLARVDDGPLGGPVFEGNVGVAQTGLEFFDTVYIVPDPASMAAELGAAITAEFVNPDDNTFGVDITAIPVVGDADGDGVPDADDECPNSDLGATVVIGSCDSGVDNILFDNGCTLADLVTEALASGDGGDSDSGGLKALKRLLKTLKKDGVLDKNETKAIEKCAKKAAKDDDSDDDSDSDSDSDSD